MEGMLTLIDTAAKLTVLLYKEFGIDPLGMTGFKSDSLKFTRGSEGESELRFEFTGRKKEKKAFTYRLGGG